MTTKSLRLEEFGLRMNRGSSVQCVLCGDQYGLITRQHVCKRCFRSVCQQCGDTKVKVYRADKKTKNHRLCRICRVESEVLNKYTRIAKLIFLQDSQFVASWMVHVLPVKSASKIKPPKAGQHQQDMIANLWGSFNFSLRQFVGIVISDSNIDVDLFSKKISSIMDKLAQKQDIQSLNDVLYLTVFLACHCTQNKVVQLVCAIELLQRKRPIAKQNVMRYLRLQLKNYQLLQVQEYLDYRMKKLVHNLGVNSMTAEVSIMCVNNVLASWNLSQYQMTVAAVVYIGRQIILGNGNNFDMIDLEMLKNTKYGEVDQVVELYRKKERVVEDIDKTCIPEVQSVSVQSPIKTEVQRQQLQKHNHSLNDKDQQYETTIERLEIQVQSLKKRLVQQKVTPKSEQTEPQFQPQFVVGCGCLRIQDETAILRSALLSKNLQIGQYKKEIELLKFDLSSIKSEAIQRLTADDVGADATRQIDSGTHEEQVLLLNQQLSQLKEENDSVNRMNVLLLGKLNQLADKITNVQQTMVTRNNLECQKDLTVTDFAPPAASGDQACLMF